MARLEATQWDKLHFGGMAVSRHGQSLIRNPSGREFSGDRTLEIRDETHTSRQCGASTEQERDEYDRDIDSAVLEELEAISDAKSVE